MNRSQPHHWYGGAVPPARPVVVGVVPDQHPVVVQEAGALAQSMGVGLICVWVDASHVLVGDEPDGTFDATPLDPDQDDDAGTAEADLERRLERDLVGCLAHTQHRPVLIVPPALRSGG